jgi:hypothetical protein
MLVTSKFQTVATVGYRCAVTADQNLRAHGGVCHLQVRQSARGLVAREVNSNGRHKEVGDVYSIDTDTLRHWQRIADSQR